MKLVSPKPPATSTEPSCSRVAVGATRAFCMGPVGCQAPRAGSYSSVLLGLVMFVLLPPRQRTLPLGSKVARPSERGMFNGPVGDHDPTDESNVSVTPSPTPSGSRPPRTST